MSNASCPRAISRRTTTTLTVSALLLGTLATAALPAHAASATPRAKAPAKAAPAGSTTARDDGAVVARLTPSATPLTDSAGHVWAPDAPYFAQGGTRVPGTATVAGTGDSALFATQRAGMTGYRVPVPQAGTYRVTLREADLQSSAAGQRIFSVSAEGRSAVAGLDIVARAGATRTATSVSFETSVSDGVLDLGFTASTGTPVVGAILVESVAPVTATARIIASSTAVADASGNVWSPDAVVTASSGTLAAASGVSISGTSDSALFSRERYNLSGLHIPVPERGSYKVTFNQAEIYFAGPGQRVYDVGAEGATLVQGVDLVKATGGKGRAYTFGITTPVNDGILDVTFSNKANYAKISSVLVEPDVAGTPAGKTTTPSTASTVVNPVPPATLPATSVAGSPLHGDPTGPLGGFFGSKSVWRTDISSAPVASNSATLVSSLNTQLNAWYGGIAAFNVSQYNSSVYTVGADQARIDVKFDDCQHKGYTPSQLYGPGGHFVSVPIPSNAVAANGTDASLTIFQPASDTFWGFWQAKKKADGWHACWGGRIDHASTSYGWYQDGTGVSATGLAEAAGAIGVKEAQAGVITHAIAVAIPSPAQWKNFSWPAQRSDGSDPSPNVPPEGTRFRLDPTLNVDSLPLTPLAKMVAKAAQKYGFILTDKAGCVSIGTESGAAVQAATGTNPWNALMGTVPSYLVMRNFPWSKLQALPKDYGKPVGF